MTATIDRHAAEPFSDVEILRDWVPVAAISTDQILGLALRGVGVTPRASDS